MTRPLRGLPRAATRPGLPVPAGTSPTDAGQVTAFVVIMISGLLLFIGLTVDGGLALRDKVAAIDQAQEAARAGAQAIDLTTYRTSGHVVLLPGPATAAVRAYLAAGGDPRPGTVQVRVTGDRINVTITRTRTTQILSLIGVNTVTVHGSGTAIAAHGIDVAQP